jgi:flagellar biosynthesis regulator FlbT
LQQLIDKALSAFESPEIKAGLNAVVGLLARSRHFEAMKSLRSLYVLEQIEMFPSGELAASQAA